MSTVTLSSSLTIFFANLLLITFFTFASFSLLDARQHSIEEEALQCLDRCSDTDDVREYLACSKKCEVRFREPGKEVEEGAQEGRRRPRPQYPPHHRRREEEEEEWPRHGGRGRREEEEEWPRHGGRGRREEEEEWPRHGGRGRQEEEEWPRHGGRGREEEEEEEWPRHGGRGREEEEEEWPRHGGRGREEVGRPRRGQEVERPSPWREYQECRAHCAAEVGRKGYEEERLEMCLERCEEFLSAWGRRSNWERGKKDYKDGGDDQCTQACKRFGKGQERQLCRFRCSQRGGTGPGGKSAFSYNLTSFYNGSSREEGRMNPYYFRAERFQTLYGSREGEVRVLNRFDERSGLLQALKNVRLMVLGANPGTFILPHHVDADCVLVVLKGNGTINLVWQEKRESYELERGDVLRVPAGVMVYLSNEEGSNQELSIAKLVLPVNVPGTFEEFFLVGSEYPESYFGALSMEVLEASLNMPMDEIGRVFGQQWAGPIIRASGDNAKEDKGKKEKKGDHGRSIKKDTRSSEEQSKEKKGDRGMEGPFNMLNRRPIYSNGFGQFFEASPEDFEQLRDLDISASFAEVNQGSLMVPHYNSRATTVVLVIGGYGHFEMACPHLAQQWWSPEEEETGTAAQYQKVKAQLYPGDVFVIPPGHPIAIIADRREKLKMVGFQIKARNNRRIFLAGKKNMISSMDRWGKEMSFNAPAEEIDRVFTNQKESYFVPLDRVNDPSLQTDKSQADEDESQKASPTMNG